MSEIDDELISEAHEKSKVVYFTKTARRLSALAACIVLAVSGLITFFATDEVKITAYGSEVSNSPIVADVPSVLSQESARSATVVTVSVEIDSRRQVSIEALDGTLEVLSPEGEVIYSGTHYEGKGRIILEWTIYGFDFNGETEYAVAVGKKKLLLSRDGTNYTIRTK